MLLLLICLLDLLLHNMSMGKLSSSKQVVHLLMQANTAELCACPCRVQATGQAMGSDALLNRCMRELTQQRGCEQLLLCPRERLFKPAACRAQ